MWERDSADVYHRGALRLKGVGPGEKGFWTGDVAGLHARGFISRELAEADIAPLTPLVARPRPFRGYFVVALNSGMPDGIARPRPLKDPPWQREYAYCLFPAEGTGPRYPIYLICPWAIFRKPSENNDPILDWPMGDWRRGWSIVD